MERAACWKIINSKSMCRTSFRYESNVARNDTDLTFNSIDCNLQSTYVHALFLRSCVSFTGEKENCFLSDLTIIFAFVHFVDFTINNNSN